MSISVWADLFSLSLIVLVQDSKGKLNDIWLFLDDCWAEIARDDKVI